jgi:hypothetical protein
MRAVWPSADSVSMAATEKRPAQRLGFGSQGALRGPRSTYPDGWRRAERAKTSMDAARMATNSPLSGRNGVARTHHGGGPGAPCR